MTNIYGYLSYDRFVETGLTEKGAKIQATKNCSRFVGYRSYINNMYVQTAIKREGVWCTQERISNYHD